MVYPPGNSSKAAFPCPTSIVNLQTISEKFANYLRKLERAIFWEQLTGSPQKAQF